MAVKFFNIRTREVRIAETEPQIAALWSSSDRGPNISQGQDFGWRLAPEVIVGMKRIKQNYKRIEEIAIRYNMMTQDIGETEILRYISQGTDVDDAPVAHDADYEDEYDAEIRRLEREGREGVEKTGQTPETATTTESTVVTTTTEKPKENAAHKK